MKKIVVSLVLSFGIILNGCAHKVLMPPKADMNVYNRIAVLPFETDSFLSTVGHQLADEIVVMLIEKAPNVEVIERTRIDALLQEQNMAKQGYLNTSTAITVGKLLGVKAIVTGSVSFSIGDVRTTAINQQRIATGVGTIRFIDVETGKVLWAKRETADYAVFKTTEDAGAAYIHRTDHEMIQEVIKELGVQLSQPFYEHYELQF